MGSACDKAVCWVMQPVHGCARALLAENEVEVFEGAEPPDPFRIQAVVSRNAPVTAELMGRLPALKVIAKHGTGLDAIDVEAADRRSIPVVFTPGANAPSVAEHALALMLAVAKRIVAADRAVRGGDFAFKFRSDFRELAGLALGIVGFGESGRHLARLAGPGMGMRVIAHSPSVPDELFRENRVTRVDLPALLAESDVISLHLPARPGTEGMFGQKTFAAMKAGAILINTSRGSVVDEQALVAALASGHLAGAGLDVFSPEPPAPDHPLFGFDNVVLSPHVAGSTDAALERMARGVAEQVVDVLSGRRPAHLANPRAWKRAGGGEG